MCVWHTSPILGVKSKMSRVGNPKDLPKSSAVTYLWQTLPGLPRPWYFERLWPLRQRHAYAQMALQQLCWWCSIGRGRPAEGVQPAAFPRPSRSLRAGRPSLSEALLALLHRALSSSCKSGAGAVASGVCLFWRMEIHQTYYPCPCFPKQNSLGTRPFPMLTAMR